MHNKDVQCNTMELPLPFHSQDLVSNSPCCLSYSSYDDSSENFVLDQLLTPWLISFFILVNCLLDKVLILKGEILSWSLMEFRGVTVLTWPDRIVFRSKTRSLLSTRVWPKALVGCGMYPSRRKAVFISPRVVTVIINSLRSVEYIGDYNV